MLVDYAVHIEANLEMRLFLMNYSYDIKDFLVVKCGVIKLLDYSYLLKSFI